MNLVDIAQGVQGLVNLFAETDVADEPWARDEEMFLEHFGVPYEEFAVRLPMLSADQHKRYADTLVVNPEAAVLWVISMGPCCLSP